ncbi:MAG: hypothetical protein PHP02_06485 [Eubacteriales bacterium]|nr:hypothetical protein [Eubacteriales bacterium]
MRPETAVLEPGMGKSVFLVSILSGKPHYFHNGDLILYGTEASGNARVGIGV